MDLLWILLLGGAIYIFHNATEQRVKALETRIRHMEKLLQQSLQGQKITEPEINEELRELLQKGKMVEAVKRTRQEFGWSLLEAKQYVDELNTEK